MFSWGFRIIEAIFPIVFLAVFAFILVIIIRNISQWNKNNHSPRLTVEAQVVAKWSAVSGNQPAVSTSYYATFQVASGDRMEFCIHGREYGMLAEGDRGRLSFQGTRYLGFERN